MHQNTSVSVTILLLHTDEFCRNWKLTILKLVLRRRNIDKHFDVKYSTFCTPSCLFCLYPLPGSVAEVVKLSTVIGCL